MDIAGKKDCQGVICGHIHYPEKKMIENVFYLNSGDWVESLSALTEDYDGNWNVYIEEIVPMGVVQKRESCELPSFA